MPTLPFCASSCIAVEKFSLSAGSHSLRNAFLIGAGDLAPKHSRVFAAGGKIMRVIAATLRGYLPAGFRPNFSSLCVCL